MLQFRRAGLHRVTRQVGVAVALGALLAGAAIASSGDVGRVIDAQPIANVTFTVNSTSDAGDAAGNGICRTSAGVCSLRAAMTEANRIPGHDFINFNIPGGGTKTILISSTLPILNDPAGVTIDGYTQPGSAVNTDPFASNAVLRIEIAGTGSIGQDGFFITSSNNTVKGVALWRLRRSFWLLQANAFNNTIVGSFIGTNAAGTFQAPAVVTGASGAVMQQGAHDNFIGLPGDENRNVVSGNAHQGVALYDPGTSNNVIRNNIAGLNPSGTAALGNRSHGIDLNTWTSDTIIGGDEPGARNVVSGNLQSGIEISHNTGTVRNHVIGNWIGTTPDGQSAPAYANNPQFAVRLEGHASCEASCPPDGGFNEVRDNVITQGQGGVLIDKGQHDNVVTGNKIGFLENGTPAGSSVFGVRVEKGAFDNVISENEIAHNAVGISAQETGVNPQSNTPVPTLRNTFSRNSVHDNAGLGIDIAPLGAVNVNDPGDGDSGANTKLNYPEFNTPATSVLVNGTACGNCTVEMFIADGPVNGFGEGETFIGSAVAAANGTWSLALPPQAAGNTITATATDTTGNTSEFSINRRVPTPVGPNDPPVAALTVSCIHLDCTFDGSGSSDPDGTVSLYAFTFGDGASTTGTNAVVTHHFASAATYNAGLTVTDNFGATNSTTADAVPTNEAPTAAFTFECTFQVCAFDGTSSSDPDAPLSNYAWDFGDGTTGGGATIGHTFPGAGTFDVTLTVTDDGTLSDTDTQPVVVDVPPTTNIAVDDFTRTVSGGWGSAPIGGPWANKPGEPPNFAVNGSVGRLTVPTGGASRTTWLSTISELDVEVTATVSSDRTPSGSYGETIALEARRVALNTEYRGRVRFAPSGQVLAAIVRMTGSSTETVIGNEVVVPGLTWSANKQFNMRFVVTGTSPTTLQLRVWETGLPEPGGWNASATDSTAALQAPGAVGVSGYVSSSQTVPVVFTLDDFLAIKF